MIGRSQPLDRLHHLLTMFPVVGIVGPRQAGKTTLAHLIADEVDAVMLDLEQESQRRRLDDPEAFLRRHAAELVILDEVQHHPDIFAAIRGAVDADRRPGRVLVLGSAAPELLRQSADTLAGRIAYLELRPFAWREVRGMDPDVDRLWWRGGFPPSYLAPSDAASHEWRAQFVRTYLERDMPAQGIRAPAAQLQRFWTMLAHIHGQPLNASDLAAGLGVSAPTVRSWVDLLTDLFLVRQLTPWYRNTGRRVVRSPRIYLRDTGLVHALLGLRDWEALSGHPVCGRSWEGFVIEEICRALPPDMGVYGYETHSRSEVDLLVDAPAGPVVVEIKRSSAPRITRGLTEACKRLQPSRRIVVAPVEEPFPLRDAWEVMPLDEVLEAAATGFA